MVAREVRIVYMYLRKYSFSQSTYTDIQPDKNAKILTTMWMSLVCVCILLNILIIVT